MRRRRQDTGKAIGPGDLTLQQELALLDAELRKPVPAEEIERRRKLVARTLDLREKIGPISGSVTELVRDLRDVAGEPDA